MKIKFDNNNTKEFFTKEVYGKAEPCVVNFKDNFRVEVSNGYYIGGGNDVRVNFADGKVAVFVPIHVDRDGSEMLSICLKIPDYATQPKANKPPVGLIPRSIRENERFKEIKEAIRRYVDSGLDIPAEWLEEYSELYKRLTKS